MSENVKLYMFLPICTETKHDTFFNVLRPVIARSKIEEHYLDNALKLGLMGEHFSIELEDITTNWNELVSEEQLIRQSKILGYWEIANLPSMGKRMHGVSWKPPTRGCFRVVENSKEIILSEVDVDALVFKKLKLRLLQLDVCKSTSDKLKNFIVRLPTKIGENKIYERSISTKVKSFYVHDQWIPDCWEALKLGKFSPEFYLKESVDLNPTEAQTESISRLEIEGKSQIGSVHVDTLEVNVTKYNTVEISTGEPNIGSQSVITRKRAHVDTLEVNIIQSNKTANCTGESNSDKPSILTPSASPPERAYIDDVYVNNCKTMKINNGEASIDSIHAVIIELRKEIENLSSSVLIDRHNWQTMIINPKDEEIWRLKTTIEELRQANENLMTDQLILKVKVEKQTTLIHALQQGVDATSKLHCQSERDAARKDEELNSMRKAYEKLQDELNKLSYSAAGMVNECKTNIEELEAFLATINSETSNKITKLEEELNVSKTYSASKDDQLTDAMTTLNELRTQIELSSPDKLDIQMQTDTCNQMQLETSHTSINFKRTATEHVDIDHRPVRRRKNVSKLKFKIQMEFVLHRKSSLMYTSAIRLPNEISDFCELFPETHYRPKQ